MARKTASSSTAITALKTGDIIWVPYRKSPKWPAVVKNVYPKKVTFFFLPEPMSKPPTFKTSPKSATLFKEDDPLPAHANKELQEAYKAALQLLRGETHLRSMSSNNRRNSEAETPVSPSTSTNSSLAEVPVKKARRGDNTEKQQELDPYTVALIDTDEISSWPVLFLKRSGDNEAIVQRFPLADNDTQQYPYAWIKTVSYETLEQIIISNDGKGRPNLVKALVAAQEFMENPSKHVSLPDGYNFPQKPKAAPAKKESCQAKPKNDVEMLEVKEEEEKEVKEEQPHQEEEEETAVKNASKTNQNGLTLSNLSLSSSKNRLFKAMLSYEAREHIGFLFAGQYDSKRNKEYHRVERASDATYSFFCGNFLDFAELEMIVAEIHNWIALSPKLPKMSLLGEMHYVSKVVLPELVIFALGKMHQISPKEAEAEYLKALKEKPSSSPKKRNIDAVSKAGNSFEQLLRAVSIERSLT